LWHEGKVRTSSSIVLAPTVLIRCRASCKTNTINSSDGMMTRVEIFVAWGSFSACPCRGVWRLMMEPWRGHYAVIWRRVKLAAARPRPIQASSSSTLRRPGQSTFQNDMIYSKQHHMQHNQSVDYLPPAPLPWLTATLWR
jgi:hypothetical protein